MNIIESFKRYLPALGLMAVCSAAILYLPQWEHDSTSVPKADSGGQEQKTPASVGQSGDKQA